MTVNIFPSQEVQLVNYSPVVGISFLYIRMACGEMSSQEAEACVMVFKTDSDSPFVSRHPAKPRLRSSQ